MDLNLDDLYNDDILPWLEEHALRVGLIIMALILLHLVTPIMIKVLVGKILGNSRNSRIDTSRKRIATLSETLTTIFRFSLWVIGPVIILDSIGLGVGPILAGAGVVGLAVGFGAQSLIKDFVAGIFIVAENQYRIGDIITVDGSTGAVEDITMRSTVLRDLDGNVHRIANGAITHSINLTKQYSMVNLDIGVGYDSDITKVEKVINQVGLKIAKNPDFKKETLEPIVFSRVESFADSAVMIKALGKVSAGSQWAIAGEFRRELKLAFEKANIEIPFPQRVIKTKR